MSCEHLDNLSIKDLFLKSDYAVFECEECVKTNSRWVHLRICQSCGKMLCCDSSPNKHASRHARESGHSVISSAEMGEQWLWCFEHEQVKQY